MKVLNEVELNETSGGNPVMAGATLAGLGMGFIASYRALNAFGRGLGAGLYDGLHAN